MGEATKLKKWMNAAVLLWAILSMAGCALLQPAPTSSPIPSPTITLLPAEEPQINPDHLMSTLEDLTQIQAYSGWRTSATLGEKDAFLYVKERLSRMDNLVSKGLEVTQDSFRVFQATEIHQVKLVLNGNNGDIDVPVNGLRGARDNTLSALRLDSDGILNDNKPDPVTVSGGIALIRNGSQFSTIAAGSLAGKIVFVEYAWLDTVLIGNDLGRQRMLAVINAEPAGIILVTTYSNLPGVSHGTFAADLGVISTLENAAAIPTILMRTEDLPEGSGDPWVDLSHQQSAQLTWDTDVLSPAESGNLIAFIPGKNHDKAVLISAHIDSANTPGALDDGSGSAILLEVAYAINEAGILPDMDLYLVWYGSEEIGLLGSANFTAMHEEIIDRLIGMLNIDCLSRPVQGAPATLNFAYGSGAAPGDTSDPWPNYLAGVAQKRGIQVHQVYLPLASDNSSFAGYNVANLDLIYDSDVMMQNYNGVWFAGHLHDPYDEVELVHQVESQFLQMAQIALDTALLPNTTAPFRQKADEMHRVLIIASHNEDVLLTPAGMFDLGLAFENAGMDVDVIPYGQILQSTDLTNVDLAIALPVFDLAAENGAYDEAWTDSEVQTLKDYVDKGGVLVITNTGRRVKYYNTLYEANEDWADMNALSAEFGITYTGPYGQGSFTTDIVKDTLTKDLPGLYWYEGNSVPFTMTGGKMLATMNGINILGRMDYGKGTVIALADIGLLGAYPNGLFNPKLVENIVDYAK